jgi:heme-degrading monooxygenase HmoA
MLLYFLRWDINPSTADEYEKWAEFAIGQTVRVPGVLEFRAYRPIAGKSQVVVTYEFADFNSWETWFNNKVIQEIFDQLFNLATDVQRELWEPSPIAPDPVTVAAK